MDIAALTEYIDVAQVVLYVFWVFFAGLIFYLQRETRREGYPLESDETGKLYNTGPAFMPDPKTFRLPHGHGEVSYPNDKRETRELALEPLDVWSGAPKEPTGNPMVDGVGPASYAERADTPDLTFEGKAKIVPMRVATDYAVAEQDPDPIGMNVVGCDKEVAGTVADVWVDQSEHVARYFEVQLPGEDGRKVLLPVTFTIIRGRPGQREVYVHAITADQFADVPRTKSPEQITLLEEDKICGYYGGGQLYATPQRVEPLI